MKIQERSFAGKVFRPKPACRISSNQKLITVITPWGQEAQAEGETAENIENLYNFFSEDKESTHPFPKLMSLTSVENNMRTAVTQANQQIFNSINQDEYTMGFELFFGTVVENIFTFIQIGQPLILLDRPNADLHCMGCFIEPSFSALKEKSRETPPAPAPAPSPSPAPAPAPSPAPSSSPPPPPLPYHLLGVHEDISFHPLFFRLQPEDRLIFLSRSAVPPAWFGLKREQRTLENLSRLTAQHSPHTPFWLAILDLNT